MSCVSCHKKAPQINAMLCNQIDNIKSSIYWLLFFVSLSSFASASAEILTYKTFDLLLSLRPLPSRQPPQLFSFSIVIVFMFFYREHSSSLFFISKFCDLSKCNYICHLVSPQLLCRVSCTYPCQV